MALSAAEKKRQQEAAARASKSKQAAETRAAKLKAQTQARIRAEANKKANDEKARLTSRADLQRAWGGGKAVDAKLKNDLRYVESQRVKKQDAVTAAQNKKPKPTAQPTPKPQAKQTPPTAPPAPVLTPRPPRSPAVGAPVHAAPQAFAKNSQVQNGTLSAAPQPSVYAPQAGAAPTPNTPQPASTAPNPFAPIGDVRGQALGSTQVDPNAALTAGTQQYGGQKLQGIDENGVDMERRRAFLDASDSMSGMKAVQNLLNKRKLSISVSD